MKTFTVIPGCEFSKKATIVSFSHQPTTQEMESALDIDESIVVEF